MTKGGREGKSGKGRGGKQSTWTATGSGAASAGAASATTWNSCALKLLASENVVPAIIGKGGAVISGMRTSCKAKLQFSEYGEVFPGTELRVLSVSAPEESDIDKLIDQYVAKVLDVVKDGSAPEVGTESEMTCQMLMPRAAAGSLIGKGGATIKQLRDSSGAKINIAEAASSGPAVDQLVSVTGDAAACKKVLQETSKHIQALKEEGWFQGWATQPGTVSWAYSEIAAIGPSGSRYSTGVDLITRVAQSLPPYVIEDSRGFALSCVVPNSLVGGLIGKGGAGTREIQTLTGARIGIRDIPDDLENRTLNIAGPFPAACAAYMLMMKRYLDVESQSAAAGSSWSYEYD